MAKQGNRYKVIVDLILRMIDKGTLRINDRLPSLRQISRQEHVSIATALQAYRWLEDEGIASPRASSGYYVVGITPRCEEHSCASLSGSGDSALRGDADRTTVQPIRPSGESLAFDPAAPSAGLLPRARLSRIIGSLIRRHPFLVTECYPGLGYSELRRQIARRSPEYGCSLSAQDIVITNGGMESVSLALRAVTSAGDAVAVESPCSFLTLHTLRQLALEPVEIPIGHDGICLDVLRDALDGRAVKAALFMTNCSIPTGYVMPEERKRALVAILEESDIPLIENDALGDLAHGERPRTASAFARHEGVLLCSSFTKTLGAGLRLGWIAPGRYINRIRDMKVASNYATTALVQHAAAEYLQGSAYDRHCRSLRRALKKQTRQLCDAVKRYFPDACRASEPAGGYSLWVELPRNVDTDEFRSLDGLSRVRALPGVLFTASSAGFRNCVQLHCREPWTPVSDSEMRHLGGRIRRLRASPRDRLACLSVP